MVQNGKTEIPCWQITHIMIHQKYVQIAIYGHDEAENEAWPQIQSIVDLINTKREAAGYHGDPCIIDDNQNNVPALLHLEGFSIQAGILFLERLLKNGWSIFEINDHIEYIGKAMNPKVLDSMEIMEIHVQR